MKCNRRHARLVLAAALLTLPSSGCVRRRLTVRTNPPGALVSVDNQVIGTSPAASSFTYYGTREIRVERDGYRTETVRRKLEPPWYEYPPLDFFAETLWPMEIRDERVIDIELVPQEIAPVEAVVDRATQLREQSRTGVVPAPPMVGIPAPAGPPVVLPPQPQQLPPGGIPLGN